MLLKAFKKVFTKPGYILLSLLVFVILFLGSILYPNLSLIQTFSARNSFPATFSFVIDVVGSLDMSQSLTSIFLMLAISLLFALNVSFLVYYVRLTKERVSKSDLGKSTLGLVFGIIGVGCASCGSLFILSILTFFGASGILAVLPLHGEEFGLIGIALLIYSNYLVIKKINDPLVC